MSHNPAGPRGEPWEMGCFTEKLPREGGQSKSPLAGGGEGGLCEFKVIWDVSSRSFGKHAPTSAVSVHRLSVACRTADHKQLRKMDTLGYEPKIRALIQGAHTLCHVWHY